MKIETYIDALISYATMRELIRPEDHDVAVNKLLEILQLDDYTPSDEQLPGELEEILMGLLDYACSRGLCQDNVTARDLFDTKLMGALTPFPGGFWRPLGGRSPRRSGPPRQLLPAVSRHKLHLPLPGVGDGRGPARPHWGPGCHHQPVKTRKDPPSHCRRQTGPSERLPQMRPVRGKCGLCRPDESPCPAESPPRSPFGSRARIGFSSIPPMCIITSTASSSTPGTPPW